VDESGTTRVSVEEAARLLGIEKQSVKKRVQRGKLRSERDASGTLWVWVDTSETVQDGSGTEVRTVRDEMVEDLRDQVAYLRSQLDVRADEIQRRDIIISQLTQATSNLTDRLREIEAPAETSTPSQPSEAGAQDAANGAGGPRPQQADTGAQTGAQKPWWKRMFGG